MVERDGASSSSCSAFVYLWNHDVEIVVSDIDGTITRSDTLGHVLPAFGRDWTHGGVAHLYSDIRRNGYNLLYVTSRAIGQVCGAQARLRVVARAPPHPVPGCGHTSAAPGRGSGGYDTRLFALG